MKPPIAVVDTDVVVAGLLTRDLASPVAQGLDGMLAGLISTARMGAFDALCHLGIAATRRTRSGDCARRRAPQSGRLRRRAGHQRVRCPAAGDDVLNVKS